MPDEMSEPGRIPVTLSFTTHWCGAHLAPYRERWPHGAGRAIMLLFEKSIEHKDIQAACGAVDGHQADTNLLERVLREFSPLCCLLGDEVVQEIYAQTLHGDPVVGHDPMVFDMPEGLCPNCHQRIVAATPMGHGNPPTRGMISFCFYCGELSLFGDDLLLRTPTPEERAEIEEHSEVMKLRAIWERQQRGETTP